MKNNSFSICFNVFCFNKNENLGRFVKEYKDGYCDYCG